MRDALHLRSGPRLERPAARAGALPGRPGSSAEAHADDVEFNINILPWGSLPLQIAVAAGVATFWRGAWYVMDGCLPDDTAAPPRRRRRRASRVWLACGARARRGGARTGRPIPSRATRCCTAWA